MGVGPSVGTQNDKIRSGEDDPSAGYLIDKLESSDGSVTFTESSCGCTVDLSVIGVSGFTEQWIKVSVDYTNFPGASTSSVYTPTEFTDLPAGFIVLNWKIKNNVGFTGGSISASDIRLDVGGQVYTGMDLFATGTPFTGFFGSMDNSSHSYRIPSQTSTSDISLDFLTTGGNCDDLTAGTADVWVKIATLT
jgi:hypothetical protein